MKRLVRARTSAPAAGRVAASRAARALRPVRAAFGSLVRLLIVGWGSLAIYYSNLPARGVRLVLAAAFAVLGAWALGRRRGWRPRAAFAVLLAGVVLWEISISPSHDRPWGAGVAVMPQATVDGDRVRIAGVRAFAYRYEQVFTTRTV